MKKIFAYLTLVSLTVACSDFFPKGTVDVGRKGGQATTVTLPDKATIDPEACEYGEIQSQDARQVFLWKNASQAICPRVGEFRYYLTMLRLAVDQSCVKSGGEGAEKDIPYLWGRTISSYSYLMANPWGPLQADMRRLSMEIYTWPGFNASAHKSEVIKAHKKGRDYKILLTPERKGFASIELLLANPEMVIQPEDGEELKASEVQFNALPRAERRAARCLVLQGLLNDSARATEELYSAWSAGGGAYPRQVLARIQAGEAQTVLNELSDGLYFMEKARDNKLGVPLGLSARCTAPKCPEAVEFRGTGQSIATLRANLEAFKDATVTGVGFVELLKGVGRADLAEGLAARVHRLDETLAEIEKGPALDLQVASVNKAACADETSASPVCRMYFEMKETMAFWKSEVLSALDLQQPKAESDGD
jgi:hypothetical protein